MVRFFVLAYGEEFAELYIRCALRSLSQPGNRVRGAIVSVYSDEHSIDAVAAASEQIGAVERHMIVPQEDANDTQRDAFIEEIKICVQTNATMVVVSPDNFWGNGSLQNVLAFMGDQDVCVGIPHMRVTKKSFLHELPDWEISNSELVSLSMLTMHPSWKECDVSGERVNTFYAGISMNRISTELYAVTHLMPTCFVCRFNAADYSFFAERKGARGLFDHHWPASLVRSGRYRVIGSSDAAFIAELTPAETHNTPLAPLNPKNRAEFHRTAPHIETNTAFVSIWRV